MYQNDPRKEMMWDIIRGEDGKNHREDDVVDDDDVSSYLDLSGEGMQQELVEKRKQTTMINEMSSLITRQQPARSIY